MSHKESKDLMMGALQKGSMGYWSMDLSFRGFVQDVDLHYAGTHHNIHIFFKNT